MMHKRKPGYANQTVRLKKKFNVTAISGYFKNRSF